MMIWIVIIFITLIGTKIDYVYKKNIRWLKTVEENRRALELDLQEKRVSRDLVPKIKFKPLKKEDLKTDGNNLTERFKAIERNESTFDKEFNTKLETPNTPRDQNKRQVNEDGHNNENTLNNNDLGGKHKTKIAESSLKLPESNIGVMPKKEKFVNIEGK